MGLNKLTLPLNILKIEVRQLPVYVFTAVGISGQQQIKEATPVRLEIIMH
jgi:hypothetical protein